MRKPKPTTARRLAREIDRHPTVLIAAAGAPLRVLGDTQLRPIGRGIEVTAGTDRRFYPYKQIGHLVRGVIRCALVVVPDEDLLALLTRSDRLTPPPEWCAELVADPD